jgi:hypothetical protein
VQHVDVPERVVRDHLQGEGPERVVRDHLQGEGHECPDQAARWMEVSATLRSGIGGERSRGIA